MRLVTCLVRGSPTLGLVRGERVLLSGERRAPPWFPRSMHELIERGPDMWGRLAALDAEVEEGARAELLGLELLAPLPRPAKNILCLGLNYASSVEEARRYDGDLPAHPFVFTKAPTSVIGPLAKIRHDPTLSTQVDWEVELAVVIGRHGRNVAPEEAERHVFGYTIVNDVTARDIQARQRQYFLSKSLDGFCPMGPCIVTPDEVESADNLRLRCWVNGELKQDSNTAEQILSVRETIADISRFIPLEPGDIIATGTPAGIGLAESPPRFLFPGDIVECEIERIGRLRNPVISIS